MWQQNTFNEIKFISAKMSGSFPYKVVLLLCLEVLTFKQNDYRIIYENLRLVWYNGDYLANGSKLEMRFFNRTTKTFYAKMFILKDLDESFKVSVESLRFVSNEYRGFPISITQGVCNEFRTGKFGFDDLKRNSNLTACPITKGLYIVQNFIPDDSKFPPFIPSGRYKNIVKLYDGSEFLVEFHVYSEVKKVKFLGNLTILY